MGGHMFVDLFLTPIKNAARSSRETAERNRVSGTEFSFVERANDKAKNGGWKLMNFRIYY